VSALSEKVKDALYAKLNVSAVVGSGKAAAVYYDDAPSNATKPYVIFNRPAPGPVTRNTIGGNILETDYWMVKVVTDESSSTSKSPQKFGQEISLLCETAIGSTLTISGGTVEYMVRANDIPGYKELVNNRFEYHEGFLMKIQVENA
jgi:hypothetical protein